MGKGYDAATALATAKSFRALSKEFTSKLSKSKEEASDIAIQDYGGLVTSPTVLSISIELSLKGILGLINPKIPHTHNLLELYRLLPQDLRDSIEGVYNRILQQYSPTDSVELELQLALGHVSEKELDEWTEKNPSDKTDFTIEGVLERNKDSFVTWRYIFEVKEDVTLYSYEYARLDAIAESLVKHLENGVIKQRSIVQP